MTTFEERLEVSSTVIFRNSTVTEHMSVSSSVSPRRGGATFVIVSRVTVIVWCWFMNASCRTPGIATECTPYATYLGQFPIADIHAGPILTCLCPSGKWQVSPDSTSPLAVAEWNGRTRSASS